MLLLNKYLKIRILLLAVSVFFLKNIYSQNLIRNGSFENYNTPINWNLWGGDFIGYYTWPPDTVMIDWGGYQTPDFLTAACPHTYSGVPINLFGYSNTKNGNGYVGLGVYEKGGYGKEYIYQQLSQPLQSGKIYCLSFYVNRADRFTYAIKNIGALFSNSLQPLTNGYEINATPQVVNQGPIISDTTNWSLIQGCFTAIGGEQYITMGNFTTNFNTDTLNTNSTNLVPGRENTSYYYIDEITLIDQTTVGIQDTSSLNEVVRVYPNPANDILNFQFYYAEEKRKVELYDAIGNLVFEKDASSNYLSLITNNLYNGIYFVRVVYSNGLSETKKIIKQ